MQLRYILDCPPYFVQLQHTGKGTRTHPWVYQAQVYAAREAALRHPSGWSYTLVFVRPETTAVVFRLSAWTLALSHSRSPTPSGHWNAKTRWRCSMKTPSFYTITRLIFSWAKSSLYVCIHLSWQADAGAIWIMEVYILGV